DGVALVKAATYAEQRAEAVGLKVGGKDFAAIGAVLGVTPGVVRGMIDSWVRSRRPTAEVTDEITKLTDARLEMLHEVWWDRALAGDQDGLDNVLKIIDRRSKLMGLEIKSPTNVTVITGEGIVEFLGMARVQGEVEKPQAAIEG